MINAKRPTTLLLFLLFLQLLQIATSSQEKNTIIINNEYFYRICKQIENEKIVHCLGVVDSDPQGRKLEQLQLLLLPHNPASPEQFLWSLEQARNDTDGMWRIRSKSHQAYLTFSSSFPQLVKKPVSAPMENPAAVFKHLYAFYTQHTLAYVNTTTSANCSPTTTTTGFSIHAASEDKEMKLQWTQVVQQPDDRWFSRFFARDQQEESTTAAAYSLSFVEKEVNTNSNSTKWQFVQVQKKKVKALQVVDALVHHDKKETIKSSLVTLDEIMIDNPMDKESSEQKLTGSFTESSETTLSADYTRTYATELELEAAWTVIISPVLSTFDALIPHFYTEDEYENSNSRSTGSANTKGYSLTCKAPPKTKFKCYVGYVKTVSKVPYNPTLLTVYEDDSQHVQLRKDKQFTVQEVEGYQLQVKREILQTY